MLFGVAVIFYERDPGFWHKALFVLALALIPAGSLALALAEIGRLVETAEPFRNTAAGWWAGFTRWYGYVVLAFVLFGTCVWLPMICISVLTS